MKNHFKLAIAPYLVLVILMGMMACNKDESTEEPLVTNAEKIIGTWKMTDGDYSGTMTFKYGSLLAYDYFSTNIMAGVATFQYSLVEDNLTMTLIRGQGDYNEYNEMTTGDVISCIVEITDNELTINYNGEKFIYTRLASDEFVELSQIEGTWQLAEEDYRGLISFEVNSDLADNIGTESFVAATDSGAADFIWNVQGNVIFVSYENQHMFGDFSSYNEIGSHLMKIAEVSATDNQLTFSVNGESYVYAKVSNDNIVNKSDLLGSWKLSEGTLTEIISFNIINVGEVGNFKHSFIDGNLNGEIDNNYWTVCGDMFSIEYQGFPYDDYSSYYGVNPMSHTQLSMGVSLLNDQLTFTTSDGNYTYSRMNSDELVTKSELNGTWNIIDGNYAGTLIFNNGNVSDSFTDGIQAGTADYACYFNGNILRLYCNSMTGDYESYNGCSPGENIYSFISLTGNQLTITSNGVDYVYTKSSN